MIFIKYEPLTDTKAQVTTQHFFPFDEQHGIKDATGNLYTPETIVQAFQNSKLVESIPDSQPPEGQQVSALFINPQSGEFSYEYADIPIPEEDQITQLKIQQGLLPPYSSPSTLDEIKANKIYELSKACEEEILAGFYSTARGTKEWYTNSRDDQSNVIAQASLATLNPAIVPQWKSAAESICTDFTLAQIVQLATDGAAFKTERIKTFETLKVQAQATTTEAEVLAISWVQKVWS